jgi:osmotically-inducible protein OsmY
MRYLTLAAVTTALFAIAGCTHQQKVEAGNASQRAENQLKQATAEAKKGLTDGAITFRVKSALMASSKLDTSSLNVDTKDRVSHLRGAVPTADQKALAERIAKDTVGPDVRVVNELAVSPANPHTKTAN